MRTRKWTISCLAGITISSLSAGGQEHDWHSFLNEVVQYRNDVTSRVYYAGTSNGVSFLYHEYSKGIKDWQISNLMLSNGIQRPFCQDKNKWVIIKDKNDERFSHWDMRRSVLDFIRRLPSESALVKPLHEFFTQARDRYYKDGTPMLVCRREYIVIATKTNTLCNGDIVCLGWPVDDYASTTNILSSSVKFHKHRIDGGQMLYVTWNPKSLSRGKSNGYFYISDEFAVPLGLVWDSDINHEALIPFDEKVVIDTYIEQVKKTRAVREKGNCSK